MSTSAYYRWYTQIQLSVIALVSHFVQIFLLKSYKYQVQPPIILTTIRSIQPNRKWKLRGIMDQETSSWTKSLNRKPKRVKWRLRYIRLCTRYVIYFYHRSLTPGSRLPGIYSKMSLRIWQIFIMLLLIFSFRNGSKWLDIWNHSLISYFFTVCGSDLHPFLAAVPYFPTNTVPNQLTGETLPVTLGHE